MKILLIEDNPDHRELIQDQISDTISGSVDFEVSGTLYGGLAALTSAEFDLVLFDLNLPDSKAANTIEEIKNLNLQTPTIALTSLDSEENARSLLAAGVQDYLTKDDLDSGTISRSFLYAKERKRFERTLQNEIAEKELFCHSLSHDFCGPVRRIESYSNRLINDSESKLSERGEQSIEFILQQCQQVHALIDGLVGYMSVDNHQEPLEAVDLTYVVRQVEACNLDLFKERSVTLTCTPLPSIKGIYAKLFLLFENLLLNAIKHHDPSPVEIHIVTTELNNAVRIEIQDNGPGIDENFIEQIFLPFYKKASNKFISGSGLGLSIAKRIVEQHQATIGVTSTPGSGTTFFLELPRRIIVPCAKAAAS